MTVERSVPISASSAEAPALASPRTRRRLLSLDVMRGLTIAAMILVNNNGDPAHAYWPLLHSRWNGWTPTDLIFPCFLFMAGVAISVSMLPRLDGGQAPKSFLPGIARRTLLLIALGLLVNGFPYFHLSTLRFYGVLQRIALCFLCTCLLSLWGGTRSRCAAACLLLAGYWVLLRYVPVPGYGTPVHDFPLLDPWKNLTSYLDRALFPGHLYGKGIYDPEGALSTLPAIANTLSGVLAGEWLRSARSPRIKATALLLAGSAAVALSYLWSFVLPFNKRLWTSSYALLAAGAACILLAVLYWMLDQMKWDKLWTFPWLIFGTNAITAYVFSELLAPAIQLVHLPDGTNLQKASMMYVFSRIPSPALASLAYSISFVGVCFLPLLWLYRKKVFIKL